MSLFDLQDLCIAIGSIATLDLQMVVDLIGIYGLKGPYCTLTTTNWFLQALSVIPRGSCGEVARRFTMIRWTAAALFHVLGAKRQRFDKLSRRRLDVATGTSCEDLFACVCRLVVQLRADVNAGQRSCSLRLLLSVLGFDPMSLWGLVCFPCLLCCPGYSAGRGASPSGGAPGGG
ncbi:protein FAR-RED IMPAIRED RESPONSE 1-like [Dorcoceras hygrometricum]|uniref:Protein FAR-RED IMPAIRED RESPONSE 1-like n=1 Tax=Dorcoceras hygrometricum TaxID=472368 RepID=A0A2Z7B8K3_9LAMI|nr:protein FAR-RED IMPAIRED RESPONSE 1-like [Dorcoceras hygrometricum]